MTRINSAIRAKLDAWTFWVYSFHSREKFTTQQTRIRVMGGASARQLQSRCKMYSCFCKSTKMYIQLRVPGTSTLRAILWWASLWWRALSLPVERFFDSRSAGQGWCSSSLWLRNTAIRTLFPSAWWRWYSVPISIEFPSKGNVSGYTCNHDSLRIGNEMLRLLAILRAFLSASPILREPWLHV